MSTKQKTGIEKLEEEYKYIRKNDVFSIIGGSAGPITKKDYKHWCACFIGPINTPYHGGLFYIEMKFSNDYPNKAPEVRMRTPIYHPNINCSNGKVCVSYINKWKNTNDVIGIVNRVFDLLAEPNPKDGWYKLDEEKAKRFKNKYAVESQNYDWGSCWDNGWKNDE